MAMKNAFVKNAVDRIDVSIVGLNVSVGNVKVRLYAIMAVRRPNAKIVVVAVFASMEDAGTNAGIVVVAVFAINIKQDSHLM